MNWRDAILQNFAPQVARFTIVSDPDGLLLEESLGQAIRERGFDLQVYENSMQFRYLYESFYRPQWEAGNSFELVLAVIEDQNWVDRLPYDWLTRARRLHFSLSELFPNLNYRSVAMLDRSLLDNLYQAQAIHPPGKLGEQATKDFILRHVFEVIPESIQQPKDLLCLLLRRHYNRLLLPSILEEHLISTFSSKAIFSGWPLTQIIPDRQAFLTFLQERWPIYLENIALDEEHATKELSGRYTLSLPGPSLLPFGQEDVRIYIDNLFIEGMLKPIEKELPHILSVSWLSVGIDHDMSTNHVHRIKRLLEMLEHDLPEESHSHTIWAAFALRWAECNFLWHNLSEKEKKGFHNTYVNFRSNINIRFRNWLYQKYSGLATLPGTVMVNHVARLMRSQYEQTNRKCALIVVDGMSLSQWIELRQVLIEQCPEIEVDENAIFAWIPTLTSVSRQAIFSARAPFYFARSIYTTENESTLWSQFWAETGLQSTRVAYLRGLGESSSLNKVKDILAIHSPQVIGLVVNTVDKIMHGMQLGSSGMQNQVHQWAQQGFLANLLMLLHQEGYTINLTSDHGNIEASGCGRPNEGATADLRGERVRIYPSEELLTKTQQSFPGSLAWPPTGLPHDYYPLIAPEEKAFISYGEKIVAHGGIDFDEVVVPFVKLRIRKV
jgi:hypothetical protein